MNDRDLDFEVERLGACEVASPMNDVHFVGDEETVLYHGDWRRVKEIAEAGAVPPRFEMAGPREKIYFDSRHLRCGIVTCGGLCPGLNDVIRAIVLGLYHHYGIRDIYGFRFGLEGLTRKAGHVPMELGPKNVTEIGEMGGTILGTSRGPQDVGEMVDTLDRLGIGILFTVGGDGTLRGAAAIAEEVRRRELSVAVIGIPKTIDNDISFVQASFGFETAVSEARRATRAAHSEATSARNGVGLVKLMGRESGFIAAYSVLADANVNFCLVPEVRFSLEKFLPALRRRLDRRRHAVIVVSEGAGQDLLQSTHQRDASGNVVFADIGVFLRDKIKEYFKEIGMELSLKYIDPSYTIRSTPPSAHDASFCLLLGHNAVHAAMAGRTNMVVGNWRGDFTHVPIRMAVSQRKRIDPDGRLWSSVLASTGQGKDLG
jgi:6-phosphofructokinase 1